MREQIPNKNIDNTSSSVSSFGEILKETRERHGISIADVAKELHVRQDILLAIEDGDFSKIPPQGISRIMVKSYSRLLGLNPKKVTDMFLDSEYSYQISQKRKSVQQITKENKKRVPDMLSSEKNYLLTPRQQIEDKDKRQFNVPGNTQSNINNSGKISGRTLHTYDTKYHNTPRSRGSFDSDLTTSGVGKNFKQNTKLNNDFYTNPNERSARERLEARKRQDNSRNSSISNPFNTGANGNALKNRQSISRENSYKLTDAENPNSITQSKQFNTGVNFMDVKNSPAIAGQSKLSIPIIAGVVVLLLIVLVCVFFFLGKQHENDKTDVSKLNVVGISDVENPDNGSDNKTESKSAEKQVEEPKEAEFKYIVKEGSAVYMEIYEGSNSRPTLAREVKSGETNTFKVTDVLKFTTSRPAGVDIFVNNEAVSPQDTKGNGVYTYVLDFKEYLQQWKAKHPNGKQ